MDNTPPITNMRERLQDIQLIISWREVANQYFHKSSSWLYHKLNGIDGNGGTGGFTPAERDQLRQSLRDLAQRINHCADNI